eukprot:3182637-Pyramimonas_sp.AAC.1
MLLAVGEVGDDSRSGQPLTLPALVGRDAILRDALAVHRPEEISQTSVRPGGFITPRLWDAAVAVGEAELSPGVVQPRVEVTEVGHQQSLRGQSSTAWYAPGVVWAQRG